MGRPPCCDKVGVKKGPWTPEEDIMLVSYVQENGPGNWRAVPTTTGLRRCSKSCRLRWTNYLRPGIKRGSFTDQEEKMIIQLQALLGNKWAAIASYFPERTDNDIKNYWNTHLKKKLMKKLQTGSGMDNGSNSDSITRGQWERRLQANIHTAKQALHDALSFENKPNHEQLMLDPISSKYTKPGQASTVSYASSTENIARLLKEWVIAPAKSVGSSSKCASSTTDQNSSNNNCTMDSVSSDPTESKNGLDLYHESLIGFDQSFGSSNCDDFSRSGSPYGESKPGDPNGLAPLSVLENWLENWLLDDQLLF